MTSTMNKLVIFAAGATIGSLITWALTKAKIAECRRAADEEIEAMHEYYVHQAEAKEETEEVNKSDPRQMTWEKPNLKEYASLLHDHGYSEEIEEENKMDSVERPYVIKPEDFGEFYDYGTVSLTYYADGILADENDEKIEEDDVDAIIGRDSLSHFGEYEDDSVFVRNDSLMSDYEILLDLRNYKDVIGNEDPPHAEDE